VPASADRLEPVRVRSKGWVVSKLHGDDRYLDLGRQVHAICEAQQVVHQRRESASWTGRTMVSPGRPADRPQPAARAAGHQTVTCRGCR